VRFSGASASDGKRSRTHENIEMTRPRMTPYVITVGMVLGLSACTNPYDPVSGSLAVASSAPVAGLQSGLPLLVGMVLLSAPQSAERWVQWAA
jgi:hypothetical protein